jgi:predicted RNA-binding protein with RPS1 domain
VSWDTLKEGDTIEGEVVRVESFGAFIEFGAERPGMVHVSEMKDGYVKSPDEVVKVGDRIQARILKINRKKRQIDLTLKEQRQESYEVVSDEPEEELPTAMALALRKAMAQQDDRPSAAAREAAAKNKKRSEQEDIIARTLRQHS